MHQSTNGDEKQPFENGVDGQCDETCHSDDSMLGVTSPPMDQSTNIISMSRSWEGPLFSDRGDNSIADVDDNSTPPTPPLSNRRASSSADKEYSKSWEEPSVLGGKLGYGRDENDSMYLTFGTCSIIEPIYG